MHDDRLPTATLVADLRMLAEGRWRWPGSYRDNLTINLRQAADRLEELTAALRPFARWYAVYGEEIAADAVPDYRRAAELLGEEPTR